MLLAVIVLVLLFAMFATAASAQSPGELFEARCAGCHRADNSVGALLPGTLRAMQWQTILAALESGKMKAIGEAITPAQREAVAKFVGTSSLEAIPSIARCSGAPPRDGASAWNGWADAANTRFLSSKPPDWTQPQHPN